MKIKDKIINFFIGNKLKREINSDWDDFYKMTNSQLRSEWNLLLNTGKSPNRFMRLCHFISMQWIYEKL